MTIAMGPTNSQQSIGAMMRLLLRPRARRARMEKVTASLLFKLIVPHICPCRKVLTLKHLVTSAKTNSETLLSAQVRSRSREAILLRMCRGPHSSKKCWQESPSGKRKKKMNESAQTDKPHYSQDVTKHLEREKVNGFAKSMWPVYLAFVATLPHACTLLLD